MKLSGQQQVLDYLNKLDHPLKQEIEAVRNVILSADNSITEHIKWNAPSFCHNGDDRITFHLRGAGPIRLVFHCGAKAKKRQGQGRLFEDGTGLLDWVTDDRATVVFADMADVEAKKDQLAVVVAKWLEAAAV
ncbi:DUF1801 domain-containing protein [Paenibacillus sp. GYB003]|uniref:DUF1801 domain-containing protein n=1 Tax=Paenibacillus sp. GYB003 TaxID=2994392 RepID=UPI002F96D640